MKTAIDIVKNMFFPQLEKDLNFYQEKCDTVFWEKFTQTILCFESDAKPVYALIYSLELSDPEKLITKLPNFYSKFLKELAENYVLGHSSEAADYLLNAKSGSFLKEVQFFQTLEQVIKKAERQRIKEDLPNSYNRLTFELSKSDIANAVKKQGREDLKSKFKQWDEELKPKLEPSISYSNYYKKESKIASNPKVISLSWMKYASIAAVFVIGFLIWQPNKLSNDTLFAQYTSEESITQSIDFGKMVTISESGETRGNEVLFDNYSKSEVDEAMEAIELFRNGNFEKSRQKLTLLNPRGKNNQLLIILAITQLKTNEVKQAVSNLEYLNTIANFEFTDEVKFHLALGYINQNEKGKAKDLLLALVNANNKYSNTAQKILDNMRWF